MSLPQKLPIDLMQTQWASQIDPVISNPLNLCSVLNNVVLKSGVTVVNHKLGRLMQGWFLVDKQGPGNIYRSSAFNSLTLTLTSDADVTVSLGVF